MKKIILLLLLVLVSVTASARKSYITVEVAFKSGSPNSDNSTHKLTGDVPSDIEGFYYDDYYHAWYTYYPSQGNVNCKRYSTGELFNLLSEYGYEVEFVIDNEHFLLSKEMPSNQTQSEGDLNKDGEVNISDINRLVGIILGYVREHPEVLNQVELLKP